MGPGPLRKHAITAAALMRHRGPDWNGVHLDASTGTVLCHERLSIVDPESGEQPIVGGRRGQLVLSVNGEIYNHSELRERIAGDTPYTFKTKSDCEVILPLVERAVEAESTETGARDDDGDVFTTGTRMGAPSDAIAKSEADIKGVVPPPQSSPLALAVSRLRGMFSFVVYDAESNRYIAARDHVGITPLYVGWASDGAIAFASELKAIQEVACEYKQFPPGHVFDSARAGDAGGGFESWYRRDWQDTTPGLKAKSCSTLPGVVPSSQLQDTHAELRESLTQAVRRRLMADVPFGALLSGGLDSSLVAAIAMKLRSGSSKDPLDTFSIGLASGSPDTDAAVTASEHIGTRHRAFTYTTQEGIDALPEVISAIETYDVTTVRASVPMVLMSRKIKALGFKMVLSGEGSDELFGGYAYFERCPNGVEMHAELIRKLSALHMYDCLRCNKAMSAFGVEARVPFLDVDFVDVAMRIDPTLKLMGVDKRCTAIEKAVLRDAFAGSGLLPDSILYRRKDQMSDAVGYDHIDALQRYASDMVTDRELEHAARRYPHNTPATKEAYLYRVIFEQKFPSYHAAATVPGGPSIACSTPAAMAWDASFQDNADPSGRAIGSHPAHRQFEV